MIMKKIILASASPRRKNLLRQIGLDFEVHVSNYKETIDTRLTPHKLAQKLSLGKARDVATKHKNALILAADTFVVFRGEILGKPKDTQDAKRMLWLLRGASHSILTGFTIIDTPSGKTVTKSIESTVYMKKLSQREIDAYVATGEPLDKAGAYGIQEKGSIFIEKIEGDYFNIVGLPIYSVITELKKFGITPI